MKRLLAGLEYVSSIVAANKISRLPCLVHLDSSGRRDKLLKIYHKVRHFYQRDRLENKQYRRQLLAEWCKSPALVHLRLIYKMVELRV